MNAPTRRLCLVGLPSTGKTTYIAALWAYLTSGLPEGSYRVTEFPADPSYLNQIARAWATGSAMPRNSLGATDLIEFTIETPTSGQLTVVLPDLPGEVFRNAILRPMIDDDTAKAVNGSGFLLLFINGETAQTYTAIGDFAHAESETTPRTDFAISDLDSDTLNSELLHRLTYLMRDQGLPPIAVVVSAWDAHHEVGVTPSDWLSREQPMLSQLLDEIGRSTSVAVIGVSAQGANYRDHPEITRELAQTRPWGCDASGTKTDIVGPLVWYDAAVQGHP